MTAADTSRRIFLRDLRLQVSIGIHDFERSARQAVAVNVDLWLAPPARAIGDDIANVVDFLTIKSKELDPDHMGFQFRLELPATPDSKVTWSHREVSITLADTSILDVLGYVCVQTYLRYKIVKGEVVLYPGRLYQAPSSSEPTIKR